MIVLATLSGAGLYAAFLYGLHLIFTRQQRRIAAGAAFRRRVEKHVRGWP